MESFFQGKPLLKARCAVFDFLDDSGFFCNELSQVGTVEAKTLYLNGQIMFLAFLHLTHEIMHAYSEVSQEVFFSVVRLFFRFANFTQVQ